MKRQEIKEINATGTTVTTQEEYDRTDPNEPRNWKIGEPIWWEPHTYRRYHKKYHCYDDDGADETRSWDSYDRTEYEDEIKTLINRIHEWYKEGEISDYRYFNGLMTPEEEKEWSYQTFKYEIEPYKNGYKIILECWLQGGWEWTEEYLFWYEEKESHGECKEQKVWIGDPSADPKDGDLPF